MQSLRFRLPTDIQAESIPLILGGGDVLMVRLALYRHLHSAAGLTADFSVFLRLQKLAVGKQAWVLNNSLSLGEYFFLNLWTVPIYFPDTFSMSSSGLQHPSYPDCVWDLNGSAGGQKGQSRYQNWRSWWEYLMSYSTFDYRPYDIFAILNVCTTLCLQGYMKCFAGVWYALFLVLSQFSTAGRWILMIAVQPSVRKEKEKCNASVWLSYDCKCHVLHNICSLPIIVCFSA